MIAYSISPAVGWLFIVLIALLLAYRAWSDVCVTRMVEGALSPRLPDPYSHSEPPCPCTTDPNYHEWVALMLQIEDESRDQEDHR